MERERFLDLLGRESEIVKLFPDGLRAIGVYINGDADYEGSDAQIQVSENIKTKPDRFYQFADAVGKDVLHSEHDEDYNRLSIEVNGIVFFVLVEREALDDA